MREEKFEQMAVQGKYMDMRGGYLSFQILKLILSVIDRINLYAFITYVRELEI
jgi:hypothetical protein